MRFVRFISRLGKRIGVNKSTYYRYRRESFQQMDLMHFAQLVKVLGLTGRELCSAFGVPYGGEEA